MPSSSGPTMRPSAPQPHRPVRLAWLRVARAFLTPDGAASGIGGSTKATRSSASCRRKRRALLMATFRSRDVAVDRDVPTSAPSRHAAGGPVPGLDPILRRGDDARLLADSAEAEGVA